MSATFAKALQNIWSATARKAIGNLVKSAAGFVSFIRVLTNALAIVWIDGQASAFKRYNKDADKAGAMFTAMWEQAIACLKQGFIETIETGDLEAFNVRFDSYVRTFERIANHKNANLYLPLWAEGDYTTPMYRAEQELNENRKAGSKNKPTDKAGRWIRTWENANDSDKAAMLRKLIAHKAAGAALTAAYKTLKAAAGPARVKRGASKSRSRKSA